MIGVSPRHLCAAVWSRCPWRARSRKLLGPPGLVRPHRKNAAMTMNNHKLKVFTGRANLPLADRICRALGDPLGKMTVGNFPDGETSIRIDEDVRGRDVF